MNKTRCQDKGFEEHTAGSGMEEAGGAIFIGMIVEVLSEELTFELSNE